MNALDDIAKVKPLTLSREATIFGGVLSHKVTQEPNPQVAFAELPRANLALELLEVSMWCEPSSPLSEETGVELRCPARAHDARGAWGARARPAAMRGGGDGELRAGRSREESWRRRTWRENVGGAAQGVCVWLAVAGDEATLT